VEKELQNKRNEATVSAFINYLLYSNPLDIEHWKIWLEMQNFLPVEKRDHWHIMILTEAMRRYYEIINNQEL
jgi:hypothetical protein